MIMMKRSNNFDGDDRRKQGYKGLRQSWQNQRGGGAWDRGLRVMIGVHYEAITEHIFGRRCCNFEGHLQGQIKFD